MDNVVGFYVILFSVDVLPLGGQRKEREKRQERKGQEREREEGQEREERQKRRRGEKSALPGNRTRVARMGILHDTTTPAVLVL